jgi:biotin carboxyl carrier protein
MKVKLRVESDVFEIEFVEADGSWTAKIGDQSWPITANVGATDVIKVGDHSFTVGPHHRNEAHIDGQAIAFEILHLAGVAGAAAAESGGLGPIHAPMTGKIEEVHVAAGDKVEAGQVLFVLEAMKMRNQVKAQAAATVSKVHVKPGAAVDPRTVIMVLEPTS